MIGLQNPTVYPIRMSLAAPLVRFVRVLRAAGLPVGPDRLIAASRALELVGFEHRDDVYWTLASLVLSRHEQFELFDQAFRGFWEARASSSDATPDAARRPGEWQTYDLIFHPHKCDDSGKVTENGTVTVILDGVLVQDHHRIQDVKGGCGDGPLLLQDHSGFKNAPHTEMKFRNIWIRPLN